MIGLHIVSGSESPFQMKHRHGVSERIRRSRILIHSQARR